MKIFILYVFVILYKCVNSDISQLRHVHLLFRHGDRGPVHIFPTDSNHVNKWPDGLGALTAKGIIEHFQLGSWLRRRYNDLFGNNMNNSLIYIRSSDVDRTLMSAESNLAGLFYNSTKEIIEGLRWRPFPIHTINAKSDLLLLAKDECPIFDDLCKKLYDLEYFQRKFQPYQTTLDLMRVKTGLPDLSFFESWKIYDTLFCEKAHNLTVDKWVTKDVWANITDINNLNWEVMNYGQLARLTAGILLKDIVTRLNSLTEPDSSLVLNTTKMIIYSGHDTDVAPLATLLGFFDNIQPTYASCILIELHYVPSRADKWAVQIFYKNYTDSTGSTHIPAVKIPGCPSTLCPLALFVKLAQSKFMTKKEYREICFPKQSILFVVQILFATVSTAIILLIVIMFIVRSFRKPGSHRYSRITTNSSIN